MATSNGGPAGLSKLDKCILQLYEKGIVKFGDFTLKSGMQSPVYFDLRTIISYPDIELTVSELLWEAATKQSYPCLCGVAYTGITLALNISNQTKTPMMLIPKEQKKLVDWGLIPFDSCLIVEDVLVSGASVYETVTTLRELQLDVTDAVVFLDREQGGRENLRELNVNINPVVTLSKMMSVLHQHGRVSEDVVLDVATFIAANNTTTIITVAPTPATSSVAPALSAASCPTNIVDNERLERLAEEVETSNGGSASLSKLDKCILQLHAIGVVKFGDFTLKNGMQSRVDFNLRTITYYPDIQMTMSELLMEAARKHSYARLCGVTYKGITLASNISKQTKTAMLLRRKEQKTYGTKKMVEGVFVAGEKCLIVEDVVLSGTAVYETVLTLRELQLDVTDAVVFLDREQGGRENLRELNVNINPVVTLSKMMSVLQQHGRVSEDVVLDVATYIAANNKTSIITVAPTPPTLSYGERAKLAPHPVARRLLAIMEQKRSNLCVSADVDDAEDLERLIEEVGEHVCAIKTHVDTLPDFTPAVAEKLRALADKHNFLLMEDRKFNDIGHTVSRQYKAMGAWADMVTAAPVLAGPATVSSLEGGVVLVAEMSSKGGLRSKAYTDSCLAMAKEMPSKIAGFVCQSRLTSDPGLLQMTPGVHLDAEGDARGQQYVSPDEAITKRGADVIIVGRGVLGAGLGNRGNMANTYQTKGFNSYLKRLQL